VVREWYITVEALTAGAPGPSATVALRERMTVPGAAKGNGDGAR